jgi:hypothetical protein
MMLEQRVAWQNYDWDPSHEDPSQKQDWTKMHWVEVLQEFVQFLVVTWSESNQEELRKSLGEWREDWKVVTKQD